MISKRSTEFLPYAQPQEAFYSEWIIKVFSNTSSIYVYLKFACFVFLCFDFCTALVFDIEKVRDFRVPQHRAPRWYYKLIAILRRQYGIILTASWKKIHSVLGENR